MILKKEKSSILESIKTPTVVDAEYDEIETPVEQMVDAPDNYPGVASPDYASATKSMRNKRVEVKKVMKPALDAVKELVGDLERDDNQVVPKTPALKGMGLVESYLKENCASQLENPWTVKLKESDDVHKFVDLALENDLDYHISSCLEEGYKYTFSFDKKVYEGMMDLGRDIGIDINNLDKYAVKDDEEVKKEEFCEKSEEEIEIKEEEKVLDEDTVKKGNKWVNVGEEGEHGEFKTKKEADAQRRAMFATGYKAEAVENPEEVEETLPEEELRKIRDRGVLVKRVEEKIKKAEDKPVENDYLTYTQVKALCNKIYDKLAEKELFSYEVYPDYVDGEVVLVCNIVSGDEIKDHGFIKTFIENILKDNTIVFDKAYEDRDGEAVKVRGNRRVYSARHIWTDLMMPVGAEIKEALATEEEVEDVEDKIGNYEPSAEAKHFWDKIVKENKIGELNYLLDGMYDAKVDKEELDTLLAFSGDWIFAMLDIEDNYEDGYADEN